MLDKQRVLVLLHWVLIIALAYLVIFNAPGGLGLVSGVCLALAFAGNLVLGRLPATVVHRKSFDAVLLLVDIALITGALLGCGTVGADFFFLFFFVVFLSALGDRPEMTAVGAALAAGGYLVLLQHDALWTPATLLRVPFFFVTAITYTYLANLAREEGARARSAEATLAIKKHFLSTMSHELRGPLHVILIHSEHLGGGGFGALTAVQREVVHKITTHAVELQELINGTLLAARLDSGQVSVRVQEFRMADVLDEIRVAVNPYLKDTVRVSFHANPDLPPLRTDRLKLKEVLTNLVTNALKYTAEGAVRVEIEPSQSADLIEIRVRDTGMGIPVASQEAIFELFTRAPSVEAVGTPGVGLGLYIVGRLLELLHGHIALVSEPGVGSTFTVHIPRCLEPVAAAARLHAPPTASVARRTNAVRPASSTPSG